MAHHVESVPRREDADQETYARWYALPEEVRQAIDAPPAWLTV
ncbi:hypothetical protein [Streptomyces sp. AK02-01A]|nr:hypothetical protein [Streptomyces sp. AK02-01A]MDX3855311.1 hypothetical protein [Streptomyces sp. AK02-01A]